MVGRVRVGHTMEAKVMESCGVTLIDENEVLAATSTVFIKKHSLDTPCICGVTNLEEALKRLAEGAAMLRSHCVNEDMANINNVVKHYQTIQSDIAELSAKSEEERKTYASEKGVLPHLVSQVARLGRLPVPFIADGGIIMPIDVAMAMDLGYDGVIVSQQLFQAANPEKRMRSLVLAAIHYKDPMRVAAIAEDSGEIGMPS
ncbi:hypothetical protein LPJ61_004350 [Coemansia biformis]|uniref:pyridoxal 5'-phosphate synthase (glutamine hydrolyzing) n=1 Tax=Coemansia biformis TaxID=1286918 RepID=A0A9W8CUS3_9FUNG|nr:hypothetical protein LPJ61_004350 [Coemansia biformis]